MKRKYIVYKIVDGRNGEVKYIGQTTESLYKRFCNHICQRKDGVLDGLPPIRIWCIEMVESGNKKNIIISEVDTATSKPEINELERFYICEYSKRYVLLNRYKPKVEVKLTSIKRRKSAGRKEISG